jgi:hypothetical protein
VHLHIHQFGSFRPQFIGADFLPISGAIFKSELNTGMKSLIPPVFSLLIYKGFYCACRY